MTIIKETSPASFEVAQTVKTKPRAKTCTLDTKNNQIVLIATERPATPPVAGTNNAPATAPAETNQPAGGRRGANNGPGLLDILVVGR